MTSKPEVSTFYTGIISSARNDKMVLEYQPNAPAGMHLFTNPEGSGLATDSGPNASIKTSLINLTSGNSSSEIASMAVSLFYPMFLLLLGVFGNILALCVLACSPKRQRHSSFYTLVGGLALTDLLGTATTSPVPILVYSKKLKLSEGDPACDFMGYVMVFFGVATSLILCCMSFERYVAFRHPYKYSTLISNIRIKILLLLSWAIAGIISVLPFLGLGKYTTHFPSTWCFFEYHGESAGVRAYVYLYTLFGLLSFFIILITNTIVVAEIIKMRKKAIYVYNTKDSQNNNQKDKDLEMIIVLIGVLVVQGVCWLPILILILVDQIGGQPNYTGDVMAVRIASLNQIIDPWIYILFRKALFLKIKAFLARIVRTRCKLQKLEETTMVNGKSESIVRLQPRNSIRREHIELEKFTGLNGHSKASTDTIVVLKKNDLTTLISEEVNEQSGDIL